MNILHVNTLSSGGAFTGAYRLHEALIANGVASNMLVRNPLQGSVIESVRQYNHSFRKETLLNRIGFKLGYPVTALQKKMKTLKGRKGNYEIISFPFSNIDITESEAYQDADIIHLHWVGDYLDYERFFAKNKKPVVWSIRDIYPLEGIFHLKNDLHKNPHLVGLNNQILEEKKRILAGRNCKLAFVGISHYMTELARKSNVCNADVFHTINNCINTGEFKPYPKSRAREILNIEDGKLVFCFVADYVERDGKGLKELRDAIELLGERNIEFLSVGHQFMPFPITVRHRHLGSLDKNELCLVYSASDAFIFPTKEEALGNVMLEAMACGTPVIGTPVGGLPDVIEDGFNGIFTEGTSADDIKNGIERFIAMKDHFNSEKIRANIAEKFSPEKIAQQYMDLYKKLLNA